MRIIYENLFTTWICLPSPSHAQILEDETVELVNTPRPILIETEFYGGEQAEEPENDDCAGESWRPMYNLDHARLTKAAAAAAAKQYGLLPGLIN